MSKAQAAHNRTIIATRAASARVRDFGDNLGFSELQSLAAKQREGFPARTLRGRLAKNEVFGTRPEKLLKETLRTTRF